MNQYLEKLASNLLRKGARFASQVVGSEAKRLRSDADTLAKYTALNKSPADVRGAADAAAAKTFRARALLAASVGTAGLAGLTGVKAYQYARDAAIMNRVLDVSHTDSPTNPNTSI